MTTTEELVTLDDGVRLRTWTLGSRKPDVPPIVCVHGGPGQPDYLAPVAAMIMDQSTVHHYDQRGVGGSGWVGEHTIARHVRDLELLLDAWHYDRVTLIGHSYGTDLVSFFLLAHPDRVAGVVYLAGPFVGPWREPTKATERARRSPAQQDRLAELAAVDSRTHDEEIEFLTLSWFPDHADRDRAWDWARAAAESLRPINYRMNAQLNTDKRVTPLENQIGKLRASLPAQTMIIGGAGDPRPASFLQALGIRIGCEVAIIADAGHQPWLEQPAEFRTLLRAAVSPRTSSTSPANSR